MFSFGRTFRGIARHIRSSMVSQVTGREGGNGTGDRSALDDPLIPLLLSYGDGFAGMVSYRSIRFVYSGGRCDNIGVTISLNKSIMIRNFGFSVDLFRLI